MDCLQLRICGTPSQHARAEHTLESPFSTDTLLICDRVTGSVRAVAITLMEFSPGMPEDRALPSAPEEVNLAEHFVHLCDIQHRRVSSPPSASAGTAAGRRRRSLLPLAMVLQTCDGRCTITTSNSIWADTDDRLDGRSECSVRPAPLSRAIKQGLPTSSKQQSQGRQRTTLLTRHMTKWVNPNPRGRQFQ